MMAEGDRKMVRIEGRSPTPVADGRLRGSRIISELAANIDYVISVPDIVTSEGLLRPLAQREAPRLIRVCKEDEAVGIAAGLAFADRTAMILIQHTGLLYSLNALRSVAVEYAQPICLMVGLLQRETDRPPEESRHYGVRIVRPILTAMGIRHHLIDTDDDVPLIGAEIRRAYERSEAVVFLIGRSPAP